MSSPNDAPAWRKSSRSGNQSNCVEVAPIVVDSSAKPTAPNEADQQ